MRKILFILIACTLTACSLAAFSQSVGDRILLVERDLGIPGHPAPGNHSISLRYPGNTVVKIIDKDEGTGWYQVDDNAGNVAWIISSYIGEVVNTSLAPNNLCYEVGGWNLEWFKDGKTRGFPEYNSGGPKYPGRTPDEIAAIANVIRNVLKIKILALSEIHGEQNTDGQAYSPELDKLKSYLGQSYEYVIANSGGSQRVAIVYDKQYVRLNAMTEMSVPYTKIGGSDIFARDPLIGDFTFLYNGADENDLVFVALHLASGQQNTENHDAAMKKVRGEIETLRSEGTVIPSNEYDVILVGDLNASWFDNKHENFFDDMNTGPWKVLAKDPYPATRLAKVPLRPYSKIDYMIVSTNTGAQKGLFGEEISSDVADVHQEIADGDWNNYRKTYSDHFPITTCVKVTSDTD